MNRLSFARNSSYN